MRCTLEGPTLAGRGVLSEGGTFRPRAEGWGERREQQAKGMAHIRPSDGTELSGHGAETGGGVGCPEGEAVWALWGQRGAGAHTKGRESMSLPKRTESDFATSIFNTGKQCGKGRFAPRLLSPPMGGYKVESPMGKQRNQVVAGRGVGSECLCCLGDRSLFLLQEGGGAAFKVQPSPLSIGFGDGLITSDELSIGIG